MESLAGPGPRAGLVLDAPWLTVVGVVGHIKQDALDADSRMAIYFPHAQSPTRSMNVVVRSAAAPAALIPFVKRALADATATC